MRFGLESVLVIRNARALTASSYLSMFFLGVATALVGSAARSIGLSAYQIGLLIAVQNIGFGVGVAVAGALSDTHEKPRILLAGSLILGVSFLAFYVSPLFGVNLVVMLFIGLGTGAFEGVTDAMLLELHTARAGLHINVNHFFVTLGSIIIALYLLFLNVNWRISIVESGVVVLLLGLFFLFTRLAPRGGDGASLAARLRLLARDRLLAVLFGAVILAVGVEIGSIGILSTYLADLRGFSPTMSRIGLIIFLLGMATGRLGLGFFTDRDRMPRYIVTLFGLSAVLYSALYMLDLGLLTLPVTYLSGLALSAILPLMLASGGLAYPNSAGTVMGALKVAIPIGGILMPFLMSIIARDVSFQASMTLFPLAFFLGLLLFRVTGYWQPLRSLAPEPTDQA